MRLQATTPNKGFNARAEQLWNDWTEQADIRGISSWPEFQRLVFRAHLRDGDVGVAFVTRGPDVKLQAVQGDMIDTLTGGYDYGKNLLDGIQFNEVGRPVAFHLLGGSVLDGV